MANRKGLKGRKSTKYSAIGSTVVPLSQQMRNNRTPEQQTTASRPTNLLDDIMADWPSAPDHKNMDAPAVTPTKNGTNSSDSVHTPQHQHGGGHGQNGVYDDTSPVEFTPSPTPKKQAPLKLSHADDSSTSRDRNMFYLGAEEETKPQPQPKLSTSPKAKSMPKSWSFTSLSSSKLHSPTSPQPQPTSLARAQTERYPRMHVPNLMDNLGVVRSNTSTLSPMSSVAATTHNSSQQNDATVMHDPNYLPPPPPPESMTLKTRKSSSASSLSSVGTIPSMSEHATSHLAVATTSMHPQAGEVDDDILDSDDDVNSVNDSAPAASPGKEELNPWAHLNKVVNITEAPVLDDHDDDDDEHRGFLRHDTVDDVYRRTPDRSYAPRNDNGKTSLLWKWCYCITFVVGIVIGMLLAVALIRHQAMDANALFAPTAVETDAEAAVLDQADVRTPGRHEHPSVHGVDMKTEFGVNVNVNVNGVHTANQSSHASTQSRVTHRQYGYTYDKHEAEEEEDEVESEETSHHDQHAHAKKASKKPTLRPTLKPTQKPTPVQKRKKYAQSRSQSDDEFDSVSDHDLNEDVGSREYIAQSPTHSPITHAVHEVGSHIQRTSKQREQGQQDEEEAEDGDGDIGEEEESAHKRESDEYDADDEIDHDDVDNDDVDHDDGYDDDEVWDDEVDEEYVGEGQDDREGVVGEGQHEQREYKDDDYDDEGQIPQSTNYISHSHSGSKQQSGDDDDESSANPKHVYPTPRDTHSHTSTTAETKTKVTKAHHYPTPKPLEERLETAHHHRYHEYPAPKPVDNAPPNNHDQRVNADQLPLSVQGRFIIDAHAQHVQFGCVNWRGAETPNFVVDGLQHQSIARIAKLIAGFGFNCVRIPFSAELVDANPIISNATLIRHEPWLLNRSALHVLDAVIESLTRNQLMVILANEASDAIASCCSERDHNGLWYSDRYSESQWITAWTQLVSRYRDNLFVVACDLRNRLRPSVVHKHRMRPSWNGDDVATDWRLAATKAIDAIQEVDQDVLSMVQGIGDGTDLRGVQVAPILDNDVLVAHKVLYSVHAYADDEDDDVADTFDAFSEALREPWAFIIQDDDQAYHAPVMVEFGGCVEQDVHVEDEEDDRECLQLTSRWWRAWKQFVITSELDWTFDSLQALVTAEWSSMKSQLLFELQSLLASKQFKQNKTHHRKLVHHDS